MKTRKFNCLDKETSLLGFGLMRMPYKEDNQVNEDEVIAAVRHAIDSGINYIDSGYTYLHSKSEICIGKALKDGYRQKTLVGTKLPTWLLKTEEDMERIFNEQLERLGLGKQEDGSIDPIDLYFAHQFNKFTWKKSQKLHLIEFLEKKKAEGYISHIGFSFHDDLDLFKEIIDAYSWDYALIQLNYADKNEQAGMEGLAYAKEHGVDIMIMEPLKGGRLTDNVPPQVEAVWEEGKAAGIIKADRTPAETAFRWAAAQDGVKMVLSGMSSIEMIDNNIEIFSEATIGELTEAEDKLVDKAADAYNKMIKHQCTGCGYCMPCPAKINIPSVIDYLNLYLAYGRSENTKIEYVDWTPKHGSDCVGCGQCVEKCPQSLNIPEIMKEAAEEFGI